MKQVDHRPRLVPLTLVCVWAVGCSNANNDKALAADDRTAVNEVIRLGGLLEDGVYPVVGTDERLPEGDAEIKVFELVNVPVKGSQASAPERIRVIGRPLLRFRNVSHFDFKFEKNECTAIGFQNTDELKAYTRDNVGSRLAVVIDNRVITHHKIREPIESPQVRITCCTVGGGDHLYKHLRELKRAADSSSKSKVED